MLDWPSVSWLRADGWMMKGLKLMVVAMLATGSLSACSAMVAGHSALHSAMDSDKDEVVVHHVPATAEAWPPTPAPIHEVAPEDSSVDPVSLAAEQMAQTLTEGLRLNNIRRLPMAILPFRNLSTRSVSHPLGERVSESLIYQLERRGYNLIDYRAISLTTSAKGDVSPTGLGLLRVRNRIYFVVTGTYANEPDGIVLNARVLDTTTRQVLASAQTHIGKSDLEGIMPGYNPLDAQSAGMIIENQNGPVGVNKP